MNETELASQLQQLPPATPAVDWASAAITTGRRRKRRRTAAVAGAVLGTVSLGVVAALALGDGRDTDVLQETNGQGERFERQAQAELQQIDRGRCGPTAASFDPLVANSLDAARLCAAYVDYTDGLGALVRAGTPRSTARGDLTVVQVPLELARAQGEYRVTYHPDGTIAGIYFLRAGVPLPR